VSIEGTPQTLVSDASSRRSGWRVGRSTIGREPIDTARRALGGKPSRHRTGPGHSVLAWRGPEGVGVSGFDVLAPLRDESQGRPRKLSSAERVMATLSRMLVRKSEVIQDAEACFRIVQDECGGWVRLAEHLTPQTIKSG